MAKYRVTSPEGHTYEVTAPDEASHDEVMTYAQQNFQPPKADPVQEAINKSPTAGLVDAAASLASGAVAGPVSGLAGIAGTLLPGPEGQGAKWTKKVQDTLSYEPKTTIGKGVTDAASYPFVKLSELGDFAGGKTTDATGSPAAGAGVNMALQSVPLMLGRMKPAEIKTAPRNIKMETLDAARQEGYVVPPSSAGGGGFSKALESVGGKAAVGQEAALRNQQVTNRIARTEAGLSADEALTPKTLEAAREKMAAPYREVADLSPRAAEALEKLKDARAESKAWWKHYDVSQHPDSMKTAKKFDDRAAAYERVIDNEATRLGRPELLDELKAARIALAKNYTIDRALNVGSGDIDAHVIGRLADKRKPLSPGLQTIGNFAEAFGPYTREASGIPTPGVSKSAALASAAFGIGGHAAAGPAGIALAGLPLLSGPARSLALSESMQRPPTLASLRNMATGIQSQPLIPLSEISQGQR